MAQGCTSDHPRSPRRFFSMWGRQTFYTELATKAVSLRCHSSTLPMLQGDHRQCVSQHRGRGVTGWDCCNTLFASILGLSCFTGLAHLESLVSCALAISLFAAELHTAHTALTGPLLSSSCIAYSWRSLCAHMFPQSLGRGQQRQRLT